jgi:hypothetical protein
MAVILALITILLGLMVFIVAMTILAGAIMSFAIMIIFQIIPKLTLMALGLSIEAIRVAALLTLLTLREITGHAARGLAPFQPEPKGQSDARERAQEDQSIPQIDGWEADSRLLGLPTGGFTKADLTRAYRAAIISAHPDVGGNPRRAQAINVARDLIRTQQGWT